jgi:hypothetical protein
MRTPLVTSAPALDASELSTVTGGKDDSKKKEKSLGEKIQEGGKKLMEEGSKWAGEIDRVIKGGKLGGVGPGLVSPGIISSATQALEKKSKA